MEQNVSILGRMILSMPLRLVNSLVWDGDARSSRLQRRLYTLMGIILIFTAIPYSLSAGYALYLVFHSFVIAIALALLLALMVINLNRILVLSSWRGTDQILLGGFLASLVLSILTAFVMVVPIEMRVFQGEIDAQISRNVLSGQVQSKVTQNLAAEISRREELIRERQKAIEQRRALVSALYDEAYNETFGTKGSRVVGVGPVYHQKMERATKAAKDADQLNEMDTRIIQQNQMEIRNLKAQAETVNAEERVNSVQVGFLGRLQVLQSLLTTRPEIYRLHLLLIALFVFTSEIPILMATLVRPLSRRFEDYSPKVNAKLQEAFDRALDHSAFSPRE